MVKKTIEYEGKRYESIMALARDKGSVNPEITQQRLRKGWPLEKALLAPRRGTKKTGGDYHRLAEKKGWKWVGESLPESTETDTKWLCVNRHPNTLTFRSVRNSGKCQTCYLERIRHPDYVDPRRKTKEDYHSLAEEKGWKWLGRSVPKDNKQDTKWECDQGHIISKSYIGVAGSGCGTCYGDHKTAKGKRLGAKPPRANSLAVTHPEISAEWHPTKNGNKTAFDVTHGMNDKFWWVCPKSDLHDFQLKVIERTRGYNCPYCHGSKVAPDTCLAFKFPDIAAEWHPTRNGDVTAYDVTWSSGVKRHWLCPIHPDIEWYVSPAQRTGRYRGCPGCASTGFDPTKEGRLYYLRFDDYVWGSLYKIGITNRSVSRRFLPHEFQKMTIVRQWQFSVGSDAMRMEAEILRSFKKFRYKGDNVLIAGNTELFVKDVLGLDPTSPEQPHPTVQDILKEAVEIPIYLDD